MSWSKLTVRLQQRVVGWLDYESRCQLRSCSKDDRATVDSTKFIASKLKISESRSEMSEGKTIIRCDVDTFTIWFIGKENITRVDRGWNGEIIEGLSEIKQENRHDVTRRFLQKITNNGVIQMNSLELESIEFDYPDNWKPKCDILRVFNIPEQYYLNWIRNLFENCRKLKALEIRCWGEYPEIDRMLSECEVSESLKCDHDTHLTDEDLERMKAIDLRISSDRITVEGAKKRLELFLKHGKKDDQLELRFLKPESFDAEIDLFSKSLVIKTVGKDESGDFTGKIVGGFDNVHGVRNTRDIECVLFDETMRIWCTLPYEHDPIPFALYPF
ncbi:hypothetical protein CRE_03731 [Caenorhabditis remanei]|uniref:DUF38 domain-containing protein n=1 Tax=Caenorhabditis remanei TaxID=31234 RepID=E3LXY0_CAERE|nr:hypothetical protein CRE_03731 [Caenorhabditis remanei]